MIMKLQFDANQQYQLDAVAAVTDLFDGQPQGADVVEVEIGVGCSPARPGRNWGATWMLAPDKLLPMPDVASPQHISCRAVPLESWELPTWPPTRPGPPSVRRNGDGHREDLRLPADIFEVSHRYGNQKFIIGCDVPSAVRQNIEITAEHFRALTTTRNSSTT